MIIKDLPVGTKLMWDADPIGEWYNSGKRIIYPAIVTDIHKDNPNGKKPQSGWVRILSKNFSWMGPEEKNLRLPTQEELDTLTWPKT